MVTPAKNAVLFFILAGISACSTLEFEPIGVNVEPEANEVILDSKADPMAGDNERIINEARQDGRLERN
ncbi:hypothetical protein EKG38_03230 [Shewanella canadensis]|uniref:Uncharacterized protein n=1 Tax=Shewanella canadensis TaxID=271096 RepID=A0A431WZM5_9GAMM|nr:hypothetical protein [Shewanella canadensis]RTR40938.1 hypothetical protein EKG38_03230 [Shewanella canadensis]